jgi:endonuclease YncB( thermonuclease family)
MTVRQTDSNQMQVWLCGIDASELGNEAREKLRSLLGLPFAVASLKEKASLVATNENQLMVIPVGKDEQGRTVAEVMVYDQGEAETSFQKELLKSGLARTQLGGVECPNQKAFENPRG